MTSSTPEPLAEIRAEIERVKARDKVHVPDLPKAPDKFCMACSKRWPCRGVKTGQDAARMARALEIALERLAKLSNEVAALGAFDTEVRQAIGNTNLNLLFIRRLEAVEAIAEGGA